jgi:hypothetical protein
VTSLFYLMKLRRLWVDACSKEWGFGVYSGCVASLRRGVLEGWCVEPLRVPGWRLLEEELLPEG